MAISREIVERSIARLKHLNFDPEEEARRLGEGPRKVTAIQKRTRQKSLLALTGSPQEAQMALERFIGGNDLVSINYLAQGLQTAKSVCRIRLNSRNGNLIGYGTGFLVGPEVVITNQHVFPAEADAAYAVCDFDYELDEFGRERGPASFKIETRRLYFSSRDLDFAVAAVSPNSVDGKAQLSDYRHLPLRADPGKTSPGEYLTIIQHPSGERKQVCVRENKMLRYDDKTVWYKTDTVPGSSGAPVFNNLWQVVALHHSGVPRKDAQGRWLTVDGGPWDNSMDETRIDWIANEGMRISSILACLQTRLGDHPLVKAVIQGNDPVLPEDQESFSRGTGMSTAEFHRGELVMTLPVRLSVRLGTVPVPGLYPKETPSALPWSSQPLLGGGGGPPQVLVDTVSVTTVEKVTIDHSNILSRPGFDRNFLGTHSLAVPLPRVVDERLKKQILRWKYENRQGTELKYYNYSVLMNKSRKLAFFAAVNIDGTRLQDVGKREGDRWFEDPRAAGFQVNDSDFYRIQLREAVRELNPFDRGHLVRRLDATWGDSVAAAKRNGDETFHFTNCSPQFWKFNQGAGSGLDRLWAGIEDYALSSAQQGRRLCVINGPVFDAPEEMLQDPDGIPFPDPKAERSPDRELLGVGIPRWFWKVIVRLAADGKLEARAFLLSQREFLTGIERLEELKLRPFTEAQARAFSIPLPMLERLTGLDFGSLKQADTSLQESVRQPRAIMSFEDLGF